MPYLTKLPCKHTVSSVLLSIHIYPRPASQPWKAGLIGRNSCHLGLCSYLGITHSFLLLGSDFCVCYSNPQEENNKHPPQLFFLITPTPLLLCNSIPPPQLPSPPLCCYSVTAFAPHPSLPASQVQSPSSHIGLCPHSRATFRGHGAQGQVSFGVALQAPGILFICSSYDPPPLILVSSLLILCQGLVYF